jgi:hypothetical protein
MAPHGNNIYKYQIDSFVHYTLYYLLAVIRQILSKKRGEKGRFFIYDNKMPAVLLQGYSTGAYISYQSLLPKSLA